MRKRLLSVLLILSLLLACAPAWAESLYDDYQLVTSGGAEPIATPIPANTPAPTPRELPSALLPKGRHTVRWPNNLPLPYADNQPTLRIIVTQMAAFDSFLVLCGSEAAMIDCGSTRNLFPVLQAAGVERFKFVINTHPHGDHMNGFPEVLAQYPAPVLYTRFALDYDEAQKKLVRWMGRLDIPVVQLEPGTVLTVGDATLQIFDLPKRRVVNNRSMLVRIQYGDRSLLLTADIGEIAQKELTTLYGDAFDADILKVPHHGLEHMAQEFIQAVSPEDVFITYRLVDVTEPTVNQLKALGYDPLFAGDGTLEFTTDGGDYWFIKQRDYIPLPE